MNRFVFIGDRSTGEYELTAPVGFFPRCAMKILGTPFSPEPESP